MVLNASYKHRLIINYPWLWDNYLWLIVLADYDMVVTETTWFEDNYVV